MAGSVGDRAIKTNLAKSSAPIDNSIACRHAVMTFHPAPRIRSQGTSHDGPRESRTNDWFHGIAELGLSWDKGWGGSASDEVLQLYSNESQIPLTHVLQVM